MASMAKLIQLDQSWQRSSGGVAGEGGHLLQTSMDSKAAAAADESSENVWQIVFSRGQSRLEKWAAMGAAFYQGGFVVGLALPRRGRRGLSGGGGGGGLGRGVAVAVVGRSLAD